MEEKEFHFTKGRLEALAAAKPGKRDTYRDTKVPGLILRVTDKGAKTFAVYRRVKGEVAPVKVTIGPFPALTVEQARKKAEEHIGSLALGKNPNADRKKAKAELTFGELFEKYLDQHAKAHKKSWKGDQAQYDCHLKKIWENRKVSSIAKTDVRELHATLGKKVYVDKTKAKTDGAQPRKKTRPDIGGIYVANRVLALIRTIFNWAIKNEVIPGDNPAVGITLFKEKSRDRRLHGHELPEFFKAVASEPNPTVRDYVLMSLLTGARRSNVLGMRWDQVSFERAIWAIPETKNGTSQEIPLTESALEILKLRMEEVEGPWVFPGPGASGHLTEPKKGWERILKSSGLSDLRLHDLRRTLGSWQVDTGSTLAIIGRTLNHKSQATTAIYARLSTDPVRASMEKATQAMIAAGKQLDATAGQGPDASGGAWVE